MSATAGLEVITTKVTPSPCKDHRLLWIFPQHYGLGFYPPRFWAVFLNLKNNRTIKIKWILSQIKRPALCGQDLGIVVCADIISDERVFESG